MRFLADLLLTRCAVVAIMIVVVARPVSARTVALLNDAGRHH